MCALLLFKEGKYSSRMLSLIIILALAVVLTLASFLDIKSRRIPNYLSVTLVIICLTAYWLACGMEGFLFSLKGMGLGFFVLFVPYLFGGMGAGDVKLMAGVGAALGPGQVLLAFLFTSLFGGVFALFVIFAGDTLKKSVQNFYTSAWLMLSGAGISTIKTGLEHKKKTKIPYGVVIACGTAASMIWRVIAQGKLPVGSM